MRVVPKRLLIASTSLLAVAVAVWAAMPATTHTPVLATDLPPGALLTIESPDFAGLLHSWNASPEQAAWLKSGNYSAFANSRLFNRLGDAQTEFAGVAATKGGFDSAFLQQVAGKESIFAWYDIGKLEFLYISHLPAGKTANVELLQQRGTFSRRVSGGTSFYVKTSSSKASADDSGGPSTPRTVAFATRGDWIILATREDLIANALLLMQKDSSTQSSEATEGWYAAAEAAGPTHHGDLHMLLDLQRITATPAFRTYWVQRNVTETRQYRAAVVDLYREPHTFREERVLLPNAAVDTPTQPDLAAVEALVPERAGVYRASANPQPEAVLATLDEKLLTRAITSTITNVDAPVAGLTVDHPGSADDLETRIDTVSPAPEPAAAATTPLLIALRSAGVSAMLSIDRTDPPRAGSVFVPIRSAVVLQSASAWNSTQLQAALLTALRSHLTVGSLGLAWAPANSASGSYVTLGQTHPLLLSVDGNTAILANDTSFMDEVLARRHVAPQTQQPATFIAGFRHTQERPGFTRLADALAHTASRSAADTATNDSGGDEPAAVPGQTPDYLQSNIASLSNAFRALASERVVERRDGALTHQTVVYTWQTR
jgi:hypothetical protein